MTAVINQSPATIAPAASWTTENDAMASYLRVVTSAVLPRLAAYVTEHSPKNPTLAQCVPALTTAAERYRSGASADAFQIGYLVYRTIEQVRAQGADLPEFKLSTGG